MPAGSLFDNDQFAAQIVEVDMKDEMESSFMPYALSSLTARAIPDVRDGLKPVQRRILYAMHRLGLSPTSGHSKSATVVGEVMGKFHPHGDSAIYETMVRLGRPSALQLPLIDPRGNFGGLDDPAAAPRYTEARLAQPAVSMLDGIDENAVDFTDTFDGARQEPVVLPSNLPNLLTNGTDGIAVGMSTSIPPHNLEEVVRAVRLWLTSKAANGPSLTRLMKHITGPDFPFGGILSGDVAEAYKTGRGVLRVRARHTVEKVPGSRRRQIVFTELPRGPVSIITAIRKDRDKDKGKNRLQGVADAFDTSDKNEPKVTVELNVGTDPEAAAEELFAVTPLESSVSMIAVAIVDGIPRQLTLREMVAHYADHLCQVTLRRAEHARESARKRAHVLAGLIAAAERIQEVIEAIRASTDAAVLRTELMSMLGIDEEQVDHVLDMRLRRLSALEEGRLRAELAEQEAVIADRTEVIDDEQRLRAEAIKNMEQAARPAATPRKTLIR